MQSIVKSLNLLFAVAGTEEPISIAALAEKSGLPRPTVYRHIETLIAEGLMARLPAGVVVTPKLALKVTGARVPVGLRDVAVTDLHKLVEISGETAGVHVRSGLVRRCIAEVEGTHGVRWARGVGFAGPIWSGAVGHVLLGDCDDVQIDEILAAAEITRSASNSLTDPAQLKELAIAAREQGWSASINETVEGACAIAAPIRDANGPVVAAMSLYAPSSRFEQLHECVDDLRGLADDTSKAWAKVSGIEEVSP